jgi:predicted amidophosphoribosyltransferase
MQCPQCQQQNPPQAKFCLECGVRLVLLCAQCGTALPAGAKFCLECGQPVDAPPTASGDFALEMIETFRLGLYYNVLGNYRQAVHYHRKNAEALVGAWLYERLG